MPTLDEFESVFRSAVHETFQFRAERAVRPVVVTDLGKAETERFAAALRSFFATAIATDAEWRLLDGAAYTDVGELLTVLEQSGADLILTYRNLKHPSWHWPYTLGSYVDVMTQAYEAPLLLTPNPRRVGTSDLDLGRPHSVVVVTDRLTGDDRLVSAGALATVSGGTLLLTHIESLGTFEYYMDAISRIPDLDTETAREMLERELLRRPRAYIATCRKALEQAGLQLRIEEHIALAHRLAEVRRLKQVHEAKLVVLNGRDPDQNAMSQLAYPLAVELRRVPMLLL